MQKIKVKKNRIGPILGRHPWVFSGALERIPEGLSNGEPIHLIDASGYFLALGYFNSYSQMAVRVWGYAENEKVDENFFTRRIKQARMLREKYLDLKKNNAYRLINSENDFLPGLIVDKYADYLSVQFHNAGIQRWQTEIIACLQKIFKPEGIIIRSENKEVSIINNVPELVEIKENNFKFLVDLKAGQKTGFFLDQRDKRLAIQKYAKDQNILNCFSYTGGFSVYALAAGAKSIINVDTSQKALDLAKQNIEINKLDVNKCQFICEDVKKYLAADLANKFSLIILDPPAFIKDRRKIHEGILGYKKINQAAMRLLPENGILVSCSCSQHLSLQDFRYALSQSASQANRSAQILETYLHGLDHPELIAFTEAEYLKCYYLLVR